MIEFWKGNFLWKDNKKILERFIYKEKKEKSLIMGCFLCVNSIYRF